MGRERADLAPAPASRLVKQLRGRLSAVGAGLRTCVEGHRIQTPSVSFGKDSLKQEQCGYGELATAFFGLWLPRPWRRDPRLKPLGAEQDSESSQGCALSRPPRSQNAGCSHD